MNISNNLLEICHKIKIKVEKIVDNVLELSNWTDGNKLYIRIRSNNNHIEFSTDNTSYTTLDFRSRNKIDSFNVVLQNFNKSLKPNKVDFKIIFGDSDKKPQVYTHLIKKIAITQSGQISSELYLGQGRKRWQGRKIPGNLRPGY